MNFTWLTELWSYRGFSTSGIAKIEEVRGFPTGLTFILNSLDVTLTPPIGLGFFAYKMANKSGHAHFSKNFKFFSVEIVLRITLVVKKSSETASLVSNLFY